MITNFEQLNRKINTEPGFNINALDVEEVDLLRKKSLSFPDGVVVEAQEVLKEFFNLKVPLHLIKSIISSDIQLSLDVYLGELQNTATRDLLIDKLLNHIGMGKWPTIEDGGETFKAFSKELTEKIKDFDIEFHI